MINATPRQLHAHIDQVLHWADTTAKIEVLAVLNRHADAAIAELPRRTFVDPMEFVMRIKREAMKRPVLPVVITDAGQSAAG